MRQSHATVRKKVCGNRIKMRRNNRTNGTYTPNRIQGLRVRVDKSERVRDRDHQNTQKQTSFGRKINKEIVVHYLHSSNSTAMALFFRSHSLHSFPTSDDNDDDDDFVFHFAHFVHLLNN